MQVLSGLLLVFLTIGLERSIYRLFFDYEKEEAQKDFLGTIAISIAITSLIVCMLLFFLDDFVSEIYKSINFYPYFIYAILTSVFMTYEMVPKISLQVKEKGGAYLGLSLVILLFRILPVLIYVVILKAGAAGMLKGAMIGNGLTLLFLIPITLNAINLNFDFTIFKKTIQYSLPLIPMVMSSWIINMSDRIFLERLYSTFEVGIYSLGYRIGQSVQFFCVSILMAYSPYFFKIANSKRVNAKAKLYKLNRLIILLLLAAGFFVVIFSKDVVVIFFNSTYHASYHIIPIIVLGYLFIQLNSLQTKAFYQEKKTLQIMYINIGGAFINIFMNYFLIEKYSYIGAAISTLITQFILFLLTYNMAKKYYFIPYDWSKIVPAFIIFCSVILLDFYFINISVETFITKLIFLFISIFISYILFKDKIVEEFKIIENNE